VFLFQCFTGLAYCDVKNLSYKNIIIGVDGTEWLHMQRAKTKTEFSLPLLQPAKTILQTYKQEGYNDNDKVLPVMCNQKMNAYLKIIAEVVGINKSLS